MYTAVLVAGEHHPVTASQLYDSFGARTAGAGWLLDAQCDAVRPGAAVSAQIPLGDDGRRVQLLGRISDCVPGTRIAISHDQPWRGRIVLRFIDEPGGSRLSVNAELDNTGLAWWMEQRGWREDVEPDTTTHRIGLLTSKTGPGAVFALSCEYLAHLAVNEINSDGGLAKRRVELVIHDDATDPGRAGIEALRMVQGGCRAIIASVTSASFESVRRAAGPSGIPIIHPVLNEGGGGGANVFRWGERPLAQVRAAIPLMRADDADGRWFHIGNDYSWSHGAHRAAVRAINENGGTVTQHRFAQLGTTDFSEVIDRIRTSGARSILSSLVGADEVAFQRQLFDSGLRDQHAVLSLVMEESTRERIGSTVANGIWSAFGYFSALDTEGNKSLQRHYVHDYGAWAPPISAFSEAVYEAILLYAGAARTAKDDPTEVIRSLHQVSVDLPRGHVELSGTQVMRQRMYVARSTDDGYRLAGTQT